jgi:hypothetical protein
MNNIVKHREIKLDGVGNHPANKQKAHKVGS